jgi:hypothetical protein
LITLTSSPNAPIAVRPVPVRRAALALADTADGALALPFAQHLARACVLQGRTPFVVVSAFGSPPSASVPCEEAELRVARVGVRGSSDIEDFVNAHGDVPGPWICVGTPTLRSLVGAVRLWLVVSEPSAIDREAQPASHPVDLTLRAPRPSLAEPLIRAWLGSLV